MTATHYRTMAETIRKIADTFAEDIRIKMIAMADTYEQRAIDIEKARLRA